MANTSGSSSSSSIDATTNDWTTGREETAGDHSATSSLSQRSTGSSSSGAFPPHGKARREEDAHEGVPQRKGVLTLAEAGVLSGASICFYRRASCNGEGGEAITRRTYAAATHELIESMRLLLRGEGPLGRVHLIKVNAWFVYSSVRCASRTSMVSASNRFISRYHCAVVGLVESHLDLVPLYTNKSCSVIPGTLSFSQA